MRWSIYMGASSARRASSSGVRRIRRAAYRWAAYVAPATPTAVPAAIPARLTTLMRRSPVHPRHAGADAAHDRVRDRVHALRPFLRADGFIALPADRPGFATAPDAGVTDVDHQLVHRDRARHRVPLPANHYFAP